MLNGGGARRAGLVKQAPGMPYLVIHGHSFHHSVVTREFVNAKESRLRLTRLPGYCPEPNPDKLLSQDLKKMAS